MKQYKTWVELNQAAIRHNYRVFRAILKPKTRLWGVVKSNAYGHDLVLFSTVLDRLGVDGFCVDELSEGVKLRESGIKKPILILGPTLQQFLKIAAQVDLTVTVSSFAALENLAKSKIKPKFHLKIDTGMHRQGFYLKDLPLIIRKIRNSKLEIRNSLTGVYTHFASAKDLNYPTYTDLQFKEFKTAVSFLRKAGFKNLTCHAAATGGTLMSPKYHLDAARIGIGLYGLWPSKELEMQCQQINLKPALAWYSLISEVKNIQSGQFIGYDLVERVTRVSRMAVVPIGYWHGFPRHLSGIGEILINGQRARVLGRVSMDLIVVDITGINCQVGDRAVIIGKAKQEEVTAAELAQKSGTTHYEVVTRINPLIKRILT
jgi:alanine racemase